MEAGKLIEIKDAVKIYGEFTVLDNISVNFEGGKTYGIAGRNGSGKTVLLKCIAGLLPLSSGTISINSKLLGKELDIAPDTGIIIEEPGFITGYSALTNLRLLSCLRKKLPDEELKAFIRMVGLDPDSRKPVGRYSMGMRQRLGIAQAIMDRPSLLLLDEPMNGLDESGVQDIRSLLLDLKKQGITIIMATHNMDDISLLCDEVYKMDSGHITR